MREKIKRLRSLLLSAVIFFGLIPISAKADVGPKPSIHISFEGLGDELCYGTLLSKNDSTGPSSAWDGIDAHAQHNENEEYSYADLDYLTWKAFVEYKDPDGYYFLQEGWQVNATKELAWTYYPPTSFKILLYFPEQDAFVTSGIYERYAFDSYYTVDLSEIEMSGEINAIGEAAITETMQAEESYDYGQEIASLVVRIIATIFIEMGIAFLFGFRRKKEWIILVGTNVFTQIVLNVLLNIINYNAGQMAFVFGYVLLEILVFVIEAAIYSRFLCAVSEKSKRKGFYVLYALVANAASFGAGLWIAKVMPGIF